MDSCEGRNDKGTKIMVDELKLTEESTPEQGEGAETANKAVRVRYDVDKFISLYVDEFGVLRSEQEEGYRFLLGKCQDSAKITRVDAHAYVLETVYWETAKTMQPITEYDNKAKTYLKSKDYYPWIGRGYVQLTWKENYKKFGDAIGVDLIANPKLANDPETAWLILEEGMTNMNLNPGHNDPEFTKYTLEMYFTDEISDFLNARKIINPGDKKTYAEIGKRAMKIAELLEKCEV